MASTLKLSKLAALVAMAASIMAAPGVAQADALAQAYLNIRNFQFSYDTSIVNPEGQPGLAVNAAATFANVIGLPVQSPIVGGVQSIATVGAGFSQNSLITGTPIPQFNYAGGYASQAGNSAPGGGGANALTNAVVSLAPAGAPLNSSSGGNTVSQQFTVSLAGPATIGVGFTAEQFLRAYLDAGSAQFLAGNAQSKTTWRLSISQQFGTAFANIANWTPSTAIGGGFTCTGASISACSATSPFDLDIIVDAFNSPEDSRQDLVGNPRTGAFSSSFQLGSGTYRFQLTHESQASAFLLTRPLPEPASLALVGMALLGVGVASRRRLNKTAA